MTVDPPLRRPSAPLYDALAADYASHFEVPHRSAYDALAWERSIERLEAPDSLVVDIGCGIGRWASRLVGIGHRVVGIEPAPAMAERARATSAGLPTGSFEVIEAAAEDVGGDRIDGADLVVAMGSLQYCADPSAVVGNAFEWLRPGGSLAVLVDSLVALSMELIRCGRADEALARLGTRRGCWAPQDGPAAGLAADLHLFDAAALQQLLLEVGFVAVRPHGLLVTATAIGVPALIDRLSTDPEGALAAERALADQPVLADQGKQLLVLANRPNGRPGPGPG